MSGHIETTNRNLLQPNRNLAAAETKCVGLQGSNGGSQHKPIGHAFAKTLFCGERIFCSIELILSVTECISFLKKCLCLQCQWKLIHLM